MEMTQQTLGDRIIARGGTHMVECRGPYGGALNFYIVGRKILMVWTTVFRNREELFVRHQEYVAGQNETFIDRLAQVRQ